jgi:hypothetical protein
VDRPAPRLLFVYNADSGFFNLVADVAHKLLSPETYRCQLCALTHSPFATRAEWRDFLAGLHVECRFLHRDEFATRYPDMQIALPAVLWERDASASVCIDATALTACHTLAQLKHLISSTVSRPPS